MGEKFSKKFAKFIKELRVCQQKTQEDIAFEASISLSYYGSIERCERRVNLDLLIKLAKAFGLKPSELIKMVEDVEDVK